MSDMYGSGSGGGAGNNTDPSFALTSSGEMEAPLSGRAIAFSAAQWQELERQTMIYKYMMASAPIPPELLMPISKNQSNPSCNAGRGGSLRLGVSSSSSNSSDPEPWRCRRTDGKKWRCSRDVVPDQKYCERHSHKSRPRSRKPVELPPQFSNINHSTGSSNKNTIDSFASQATRGYHHHQNTHSISPSENHFHVYSTLAPALSSCDQPGGLKWLMKEETISVSNAPNQDLQQMVQSKVGLSRDNSKFSGNLGFFDHDYHRQNDQFVATPNLGSLEGLFNLNQTQRQETRHFFDAWSKVETDCSNIEAIDNNCSLSLSMSSSVGGESNAKEEMENEQMGARHVWMSQEGLWTGSPPGGPLAEALCLGVPNSRKGPSSGGSISSTTTSSCSRSSN